VKKVAFLVLSLFATTTALGSEGKNKHSMGVGLGVVSASIEDPNGSAETTPVIFPTFIYYVDMSRDQRAVSKFSYYDFSLNASQTDIGQEVTSLSFAGIYEWRQRIKRDFKPFLGAGLSFNSESIKSRHTVDNEGFLDQRYQDLDNAGFSLLLSASIDIEVADSNFQMRGVYTIPTYDGVSGIELSLLYLF